MPGDDTLTAFRSAAVIAAPPGEVWRVLTDWDGAHRWLPGVTAARADGPTEPGTTLTCRTAEGERETRLLTVQEPDRLVLRTARGPITADYSFTLGPATVDDAPATVVTLVAEVDYPGLEPDKLQRVHAVIAETDRVQPQLLRDLVEGRAAG